MEALRLCRNDKYQMTNDRLAEATSKDREKLLALRDRTVVTVYDYPSIGVLRLPANENG
jgi:hypothetical protein